MKVSQIYPSKFFRAADLAGGTLLLTIEKVLKAQFRGNSEEKLQLHFREDSKALTLNKTNSGRLADALGDETDGWKGSKIELYVERVKFGEEMIDSIRVRVPELSPQEPRSSAAPPRTKPAVAGKFDDMEDDIPF